MNLDAIYQYVTHRDKDSATLKFKVITRDNTYLFIQSIKQLKSIFMKAATQYNDYVGTVAADIGDHIELNYFISNRGVSVQKYETIGARLFSSNIGGFSASIICIDKVQSTDNKEYIVQLDFNDEINSEEFFSLFKRFEVIFTSNNEKYQDIEVDEIRKV